MGAKGKGLRDEQSLQGRALQVPRTLPGPRDCQSCGSISFLFFPMNNERANGEIQRAEARQREGWSFGMRLSCVMGMGWWEGQSGETRKMYNKYMCLQISPSTPMQLER